MTYKINVRIRLFICGSLALNERKLYFFLSLCRGYFVVTLFAALMCLFVANTLN